jgi:hypothetical protein
MTPDHLKSDGERLVAAYLSQRGFHHFSEYERPVGGKLLDFSVDHPDQSFVMEVYEPHIRIPKNGGWFSSYDGLRGMFERNKREQIRAAKNAGLPFVGVLARTNSDIDFGPDLVAGAMFGDLTINMPIAEGGESLDVERGVTAFGSGGKVQPGQMRGVSAVAIVRRFNPTAWKLTKELNARTAGLPSWHAGMTEGESLAIQTRMADIATEIEHQFLRSGTYDPAAAVARLIVLHNPYADRSLWLDILNGPHDEQWLAYRDAGATMYGERSKGSLIDEVPHRS